MKETSLKNVQKFFEQSNLEIGSELGALTIDEIRDLRSRVSDFGGLLFDLEQEVLNQNKQKAKAAGELEPLPCIL